jgi:uncharacterized protein YyaL (SSP411 family)
MSARIRKFGIWLALLSFFPVCALPAPAQASTAPVSLQWQPWSDSVFAQAKREHKFVLLDLEAVWCHWCHVMDEVTYADPEVRKELSAHYLLVKVDQDSRPDLSNRYEDYGWPATVVFNAEGGEIVKRQGYMPPRPMLAMLEAIVKDPSPGPSVAPEAPVVFSSSAAMPAALVASLRRNFDDQYDADAAGWGFGHKYLDADSLEYGMLLALHGDKVQEQRVRATLAAEQKLIDPVWGGAYQYSVDGKWDEPHYEKLIGIQADVLRTYAAAYAQWRDPGYLRAAQSIQGYVRAFLTSPEGAFYVSQDADLHPGEHSDAYYALGDTARRRQGTPRVDQHLYARENGWMIQALCALYAASGDRSALDSAEGAAKWVVAHRSMAGGGFHHGDHDAAGPYLGDTLAMGRAFVALYTVTGDRQWLTRAQAAAQFISARFAQGGAAGFATSASATDAAYHPHPERDENAQLARFANLLFQYTGDASTKAIAERAMRYLATPPVALRPMAGTVLLAETEFTSDPIHITIVGSSADPATRALFTNALASPSSYKRIELLDPKQGKPVRADVTYPELSRPAAFLCRQRSCSTPIFETPKLAAKIDQALRQPQA